MTEEKKLRERKGQIRELSKTLEVHLHQMTSSFCHFRENTKSTFCFHKYKNLPLNDAYFNSLLLYRKIEI